MTLALALIALSGWLVAAWLYCSRRRERLDHATHAGAWFAHAIQQDHEIDTLREQANKPRRNTGKAEL